MPHGRAWHNKCLVATVLVMAPEGGNRGTGGKVWVMGEILSFAATRNFTKPVTRSQH